MNNKFWIVWNLCGTVLCAYFAWGFEAAMSMLCLCALILHGVSWIHGGKL